MSEAYSVYWPQERWRHAASVCQQVLYVLGRMRIQEIIAVDGPDGRGRPRPVKHVSEDGRLIYSLSVQGIYRLAESSAADLDAVLEGPPGRPVPLLSGAARIRIVPENMDTLF